MTLEQRTARRAECVRRMGEDRMIPESERDAILAYVGQFWEVRCEDFTGFKLNLSVASKWSLPHKAKMDAEAYLMNKYGNMPFCWYTDFTDYRLTFGVN